MEMTETTVMDRMMERDPTSKVYIN
jgi:hypothetical protein